MTVLEKYPCNSRAEAHLKERRVIEELKPTLNENIPCRSYRELREKNKEQYNAYMREYMKKYYQRKKKEKEGVTNKLPLMIQFVGTNDTNNTLLQYSQAESRSLTHLGRRMSRNC